MLMASNETKSTNALNVNGVDVISPKLSEAELAWAQRYDELKQEKLAMGRVLRAPGWSGTASDTPETQNLKKAILDIEYQQRLHVEAGSKSEHTFREAIKEKYYVPQRQEPIGGMLYNNYGVPPHADMSDAAAAHKDWVLEKARNLRDNMQHVKEGIGEAVEASKPYARETVRILGSAAIDSVGPSPSKLLPLPKTPHPHMDFLRDGILDESASRAGIPPPRWRSHGQNARAAPNRT